MKIKASQPPRAAKRLPTDILDVPLGAGEIEIRGKFLEHVKNLHPDQFQDPLLKRHKEHELREIQRAYELLMLSHSCEMRRGEPADGKNNVWQRMPANNQLESLRNSLRRLRVELTYCCARRSLDKGDYEDAIQRLGKLAKYYPNNWVIQLNLAEALYRRGLLQPSREIALKLLDLKCGQHAHCLLLLGWIEEKLGNLRQARKYYVDAYKLDPKDQEIKRAFERGPLAAKALTDKLANAIKGIKLEPNTKSFRLTGLY